MAYNENAPTIPLRDLIWAEIGDEDDLRNRLLAHIKIGPLDMHLEAIEVYDDDDGMVRAKYDGRDDNLGSLMDMEETAFSRLDIDGREYVLYATPFGR